MDNYEPAVVLGKAYHKLRDQKNTANVYGDWDPERMTVEDSAFGFVTMKNGAAVTVEASWALNKAEDKTGMFTCLLYTSGAKDRRGIWN